MSDSILTGFLQALTEHLSESVAGVRGEVENALHQRLESTGSKQKQARQLNTVAKASEKYITKVHHAFEKNFAKFELYVRRNIVSIPSELADEMAKIQAEKRRKDIEAGTETLTEEDTTLTKEEREERQMDAELEALNLRLRELTASNQQLELEQKALDERSIHFQGLVKQLAFLDDISERVVLPLKRTAEHISPLHESFLQMSKVQAALENDIREFKRSKLATRKSFRNLRKHFTTKTAETTYRTTEDLHELHSKLLM